MHRHRVLSLSLTFFSPHDEHNLVRIKPSYDSLPFFPFVLVISCDFDQSMCGFVQDKNDKFDWTRRKGSTLSSFTGPFVDHTGYGGCYNISLFNFIATSEPVVNTSRVVTLHSKSQFIMA